jgi:rare lipoprotein A (peptidoglycan hydrolase)
MTTNRQVRNGVIVFLLLAAILMFAPSCVKDAEAHPEDASSHNWQVSEAAFYGPGFYGNRTACGQTLTPDTQGVAHKTLPCGTLVRFEWHGRELVVPVIDRGPYTHGREWDLTSGACHYLSYERPDRCSTGAIAWTR